jgi:hypothetical protein
LPEEVVAFKALTVDFREPKSLTRNMTQKNQQVRLRLGRNAWLVIIIFAIALCGTTAQPSMARGRPVEIADAVIERNLVYNRINGRALRLDLYCPQKSSSPSPVIRRGKREGARHRRGASQPPTGKRVPE